MPPFDPSVQTGRAAAATSGRAASAPGLAALVRAHDWGATPLGPAGAWPAELRTLVDIALGSNQPMFVAWGPSRTLIYNDPYAEILQAKHPSALGRDFLDVWSEIRPDLEGIVAEAYAGRPVQMDDITLFMERRGFREETHFAFFYSPVRDASGGVRGFFCACTEITREVFARRRRDFLLRLGERLRDLAEPEAIAAAASEELGRHLGAAAVGYAEWEDDGRGGGASSPRASVLREWSDGRLPSLVGTWRLDEFGPGLEAAIREGRPVVVADTEADPRTRGGASFAETRVRAFLDVPLVKRGKPAALLFVHAPEPRDWTADDVSLAEEVAERVWSAAERARAEAALRRSEAALRRVQRIGRVGGFEIDLRSRVSHRTPEYLALHGLPADAESWSHEDWVARLHPDDRERAERVFWDAVADGPGGATEYAQEYRIVTPGGETRWIAARAVIERDPATGAALWMRGAHVDVTGRRKAEQGLAERDARLRSVLEGMGEGFGLMDRDFRILEQNAEALRLDGRPAAEIVGKTHWEAYPGTEDSELGRAYRRAMAERAPVALRHCYAPPGGEERCFDMRAYPMEEGLAVFWRDVSEERRVEAAAREAAERVELALEAGAIAGTWMWDVPTNRFTADERFARSFDLDPARCRRGLTLEEVVRSIHPDDVPGVAAAIEEALSRGGPYRRDYRVRRPDGAGWRWVEASGRVELGPDGRALRFPGVLLDIQARRESEAARAEAEERLRLATDAAEVGFWDVDVPTGNVVWPDRVKAMFGMKPDAPVTMDDFAARLHPEDRERVVAAFAAATDPARRALYDVEYRTVGHPDGGVRWVAAKGRGVFDGATGRCVRALGTAIDITARKAAESRLRRVLDGLFAFVGVASPDGTLVELNAAPLRAAGRRQEEVVGRPLWHAFWREAEDSEVTARVRDAVARAAAGETVRFDLPMRLRDGWLTVDFQIAPLRDEAGRVTHLVPSAVPVEERVRAERRLRELNAELESRVAARTAELAEAQATLAHARRMEALGQLAGGIAHDFNNVLQAVQGGVELIGRRPGDPEGVRRLARMVGEAADRGSSITRRLLAFSRRGDLRAERLEVAPLLEGVREVLAHTLGAGVEVRVEAREGLPALLADKGQLETALVNLATNARDAMEGGGRLTLSASVEAGADGLPPGRYVRLDVADTGGGMPPEVLARASEPFFTTKPPGKGTGLGLAMARGFAEQSGGGLRIASAPGRGTTVSLWLPVAGEADGARPAATRPAAVAAGHRSEGARVLLADDDASVRAVLAEGLAAAGFRVTAASDAASALAALGGSEGFDALVTDLSMPGLDGVALIAEARRRAPGLPAVLLTGFATDAAELALGAASAGGPFALLRKPVEAEGLAARIGALLGAEAHADGRAERVKDGGLL